MAAPYADPLRDNPRSSGALLDTLELVPVAVGYVALGPKRSYPEAGAAVAWPTSLSSTKIT